MDVTVLLCDAAQSVGGKLYILGGGWSQLLVPDHPRSMALAMKIAVPWDRANEQHRILVRLITADGEEVTIPNPAGGDAVPLKSEAGFETGRPAGIPPGTSLDVTPVFNFNNLALSAGSYVWEIQIDGKIEATVPFRVGQAARRQPRG